MISATLKGISIFEYVENDKKEFLVLNYKMTDEFSDEKYLEIFEKLKNEGIIKNSNYSDTKWVLKMEEGYKCYISFDLGVRPFLNEKLRHYILMKLHVQKIDVETARICFNQIKAELLETHFLDRDYINTYREQVGMYNESRKRNLPAFKDFLRFGQMENAKEFFNIVDEIPQVYTHKSRKLPCYQSIILFDYIINDYVQKKIF